MKLTSFIVAQLMSRRRSRASFGVCAFFVLSSCLICLVERAQAQDISAPRMLGRPSQLHGPDQLNRPRGDNQFNGVASDNLNRHYSSTGKPCLVLQPQVTNQVMNKKIFEHWIKASNGCGQNIKVQVCYHKTADCIVMTVPPWETKNAVLGIQPDLKDFQFDAKEK